MIKAVKEFLEKAEGKKIKTVFTGKIVIRGNLGDTVLEGKETIRNSDDSNLIYNFKNQLKKKDLVFISENKDKMIFNFFDMGTGAIYTIID